MKWVILLILLLPVPLFAQVRVTGGEHGAFTRIVLQGPGLTGWQVMRAPDGYHLALRGAARFDLSRAFDRIDRQRVGGLAPLAGGDGLALTLRCACHAIAFDFRPGIVVIDLRDGPPPKASSFELDRNGQRLPPLRKVEDTVPRPRLRPLVTGLPDWTVAARLPPDARAPTLPGPDAVALRAALLVQFARAASQGLIDTAPAPPPLPPTDPAAAPRQASVALGSLPGLRIAPATDPDPQVAADGTACIPPERIAVETWGDPSRPALPQLAESMAGLMGEFDRPDPDAVARAVRLRIWLGFGAEAAQLAQAMGSAEDQPLWLGMARLVDGATDGPAFAGMAGCDGPAALWATLAARDLPPEADVPAILRAFSALPPHLRQHLGPALADRFLRASDATAAQSIRDAMARDAPDGTAAVDAALALHRGDPDRAEDAARAMMRSGTDPTAALVALVQARAAQDDPAPVSAADVTALEAALHETPDAPDLLRATALARALAGDFDGAFALAPQSGAEADLWRILAKSGPDSALITHAILPADAVPQTDTETTRRIAERLTDLRFGTAALRWIGPQGDPVLAAKAELARNDPRAALWRLNAATGAEADHLRAEAMQRSGTADTPRAAEVGPTGGTTEAWKKAEDALADSALPQGPLARSRAILDAVSQTRAALDGLLESTAIPDAPALTESQRSGG